MGEGKSGTAVEAVAGDGFLFLQWSDGSTVNPRTDVATADLAVFALFRSETVESFGGWLIDNSLDDSTQPMDDPGGGGVPNLLKYAFNISPIVGNPVYLVSGTGDSGMPVVIAAESGSSGICVEYVRRRKAIDLMYQVEFSGNLTETGWIVESDEIATVIDEEWERVVVEDPVGVGDSERRFGRVRVELLQE